MQELNLGDKVKRNPESYSWRDVGIGEITAISSDTYLVFFPDLPVEDWANDYYWADELIKVSDYAE